MRLKSVKQAARELRRELLFHSRARYWWLQVTPASEWGADVYEQVDLESAWLSTAGLKRRVPPARWPKPRSSRTYHAATYALQFQTHSDLWA